MKNLVLLFLLLSFTSCAGKSKTKFNIEARTYQQETRDFTKSDSLLVNIQRKINNAFIQSLISKDNKPLLELTNELEELNKSKKQNIILYWRSYLQFYYSIFYLEKGDKESSEKEIDKGIGWLNFIKNKNSEDYALLSRLQGFGIQFKGMKAMFFAKDIERNAKKAIAMDSTNLRGYYVFASNYFYTPEKYGGGQDAEKYLIKAISLPDQKIKNDYLPSWGKEESYEMLIKLYIKKEKWVLAKKYFQEGIKEYPESYTINQLASKLVGK